MIKEEVEQAIKEYKTNIESLDLKIEKLRKNSLILVFFQIPS